MIGMLQDKDKTHGWDFVPTLVHAYNCTKSNVMEFSPYKLGLGLDLHFDYKQKNNSTELNMTM